MWKWHGWEWGKKIWMHCPAISMVRWGENRGIIGGSDNAHLLLQARSRLWEIVSIPRVEVSGEAADHICPSVSSSVLLSVGGIVLYRFFEREEKGPDKRPITAEARKDQCWNVIRFSATHTVSSITFGRGESIAFLVRFFEGGDGIVLLGDKVELRLRRPLTERKLRGKLELLAELVVVLIPHLPRWKEGKMHGIIIEYVAH